MLLRVTTHFFSFKSLWKKKKKNPHTEKQETKRSATWAYDTYFQRFLFKTLFHNCQLFLQWINFFEYIFKEKKKCRILWFQLLKCENDAFFYSVNWTVRNRQKVFNHCQSIWWLFSWLTGIQLPSSGGLKRKVTLSDCNPTHEPTNTNKTTNKLANNYIFTRLICAGPQCCRVLRETSRVQTKKRALCEQSLRSTCLSAADRVSVRWKCRKTAVWWSEGYGWVGRGKEWGGWDEAPTAEIISG